MDDKNKPDFEEEIEEEKPKPKNAVHRLYDKIPLTYRQVDILVKVLIGILAVVLIVGVATGSRFSG